MSGALATLRATSAGLWSVANNCSKAGELGTTMRARAEAFDKSVERVAELVEALRAERKFGVPADTKLYAARQRTDAALAEIGDVT